mmetsp:Transcript_119620/g.338616  ORF Transcript_119620/g.338616 Transcript_119620/m.338616 type:complete len:220 (-) Transcript_119620:1681-2340(-)
MALHHESHNRCTFGIFQRHVYNKGSSERNSCADSFVSRFMAMYRKRANRLRYARRRETLLFDVPLRPPNFVQRPHADPIRRRGFQLLHHASPRPGALALPQSVWARRRLPRRKSAVLVATHVEAMHWGPLRVVHRPLEMQRVRRAGDAPACGWRRRFVRGAAKTYGGGLGATPEGVRSPSAKLVHDTRATAQRDDDRPSASFDILAGQLCNLEVLHFAP